MATPTQAQLTEERAAIAADLADKQSLYNRMIEKGQVNSAKELLESINTTKSQLTTISNQITNYTQFSADRIAADAELAQTADFETRNAPANQTVTSSTTSTVTSTTGGNQTTTTGGAFSLTPEAKAESKNQTLRAHAFNADPTGRFGPDTIKRAESSGAITSEEAAALRAGSISEAERNATATAARQSSLAAAKAGTIPGPTTTTVTPTPNTTGETTVNEILVTKPATITGQSNPTNNTTTITNNDGTLSDVTVNPTESTSTITPISDNELIQDTETTITVTETSNLDEPPEVNITDDEIPADNEITGFEPLREPPNTEEDEFSGIDEQIQRQKDIEDGTAEFAGIDEQIAINENTLQEPPLLTDEEVDAELARAAAENDEPVSEENATQGAAAAETNVAGSTSRALTSNPAVTVTPYKQDDWRIRLSLAGSADYLYKVATKADILYPLIATDGVVFPYSPTINSSYRANYDPSELTHSNYKMFFYKNSSVDDITIGADFTAQDTAEANYMLAVIHFFKSATKMFYGQDTSPRAGTPPPLLYLTGYGLHQFQKHPLLLTNFSYNLPNDVDYIRAGSNAQWGGVSIAQLSSGSKTRLGSSGLTPGGVAKPAAFSGLASQDKVTYVPTKISLSLTLVPVVTRNDISKNFSLKDYAAGKLSAKTGGGIW
jgi:hypothetical protein